MYGFSNTIQQQLKHDTPFAWVLRDQASTSPIFHKRHLAELDDRLEAYLDCYLISQRAGKSLLPTLEMSDWGAVFVTALTAIRTNDADSFELALDALEEDEQAKELSDALCWTRFELAKPFLDKVILHKNPLARIAGITAVGYFTPQISPELLDTFLKDNSSLAEGSPAVLAATLKVIGENKLTDYDEKVWDFLTHENEEVRFRAAYTGNLIGVQGANEALQKFCFGDETPYLREALSLLFQIIQNDSTLLNEKTTIEETALILLLRWYIPEKCTIKQHLEAIQMFIDFGADINASNSCGSNPLHNAISSGEIEVINLLIKQGINVNPKHGFIGQPTLHLASLCKSSELIKLLVEKGADINALDDFGQTALHVTVENDKSLELTKLLISYGAGINTMSNFESTPLDDAYSNKSMLNVKYLMDIGGTFNITTVDDMLEMDYKEELHFEILDFFSKKNT